jgi:hypothetical protein
MGTIKSSIVLGIIRALVAFGSGGAFLNGFMKIVTPDQIATMWNEIQIIIGAVGVIVAIIHSVMDKMNAAKKLDAAKALAK